VPRGRSYSIRDALLASGAILPAVEPPSKGDSSCDPRCGKTACSVGGFGLLGDLMESDSNLLQEDIQVVK
jgi:hypothetical protein